jgi:hypothetical protein
MSNFLEIIGDLFGNIFGNSPDAQRRRELRRLEELLVVQHPNFYQRSGKKVLPTYAYGFVQLQKFLNPIQDLFSKTINHPDAKTAEFYRFFLLENLLEGDITNRRIKLSYEQIKTHLMATTSLTDELSSINHQFNSLINDVKKMAAPEILNPMDRAHHLAEWFKHSLADFYAVFNLEPDGSGTPQPADSEKLLVTLLDIYYVYRPLQLDEALETALAILLERISPQKATENINNAKKVLQKVRILTQGIIKPQIMEILIKILQDDPYFEPPYEKTEHDFLMQYVTTITERFERDRDRAASEVTESGLEDEVNDLFQERPLLELNNYQSDKNQVLVSKSLNQLSLVKPMAVFKSFIAYHLNGSILGAFEKVLTDSIFIDKNWGAQLSNLYSLVKNINQRILELELELIGEGRATITQLDKIITRSGITNIQAPANRIIELINKRIENFLVEQSKYLFNLAEYIKLILEDFKRPTPEFISNIRSFGDKKNKLTLQALLDGYKSIIKLLQILKNFIVMPYLKFKDKEPT